MGDFLDDDYDYYDGDELIGRFQGTSPETGVVLYQPSGLMSYQYPGMLQLQLFPGGGRASPSKSASSPRVTPAESSTVHAEYSRPRTAFGTHEMTPGPDTGHLPALVKAAPSVRAAYAKDSRSWWQGPDGRDIPYSVQDVPVGRTRSSIGYYEGEFNPGQAATPLVSLTGPRGERVVADASRLRLTSTEGFRAYLDGQAGGGWSIPIPGQKLSRSNSYEIALPRHLQNERGLTTALSVSKPLGFPDIIHYGGPKAIVTQFNPERAVPLSPELNRVISTGMRAKLGSDARPVYRDGAFAGYDWTKGVGSGTATRQLLKYLNPADVDALSSPPVRERVLHRFDQDAEVAASLGTPFRPDLQNARRIFVRRGIEGLDAALNQGVLPTATVGLFLPYLVDASGARGDDTTRPRAKQRRRRRRVRRED